MAPAPPLKLHGVPGCERRDWLVLFGVFATDAGWHMGAAVPKAASVLDRNGQALWVLEPYWK